MSFSVILARFIEFVALVYVPVLSTSLQSLQQSTRRPGSTCA